MHDVATILGWVSGGAIALAVGCGGNGDGTAPPGGGAGGTVAAGGRPSTGGGSAGIGGSAGSQVSSAFGPYLASCDYRETDGSLAGRCRDWYGGPNPPNLATSCNDIYMREPCPSERRVGQCQLDPVLGVVAVYNYYAPTWTAETAMDNCVGGYRSDNKTWIPAPGVGDAGPPDEASDAGL